jgi:hypothetical protein
MQPRRTAAKLGTCSSTKPRFSDYMHGMLISKSICRTSVHWNSTRMKLKWSRVEFIQIITYMNECALQWVASLQHHCITQLQIHTDSFLFQVNQKDNFY